MQQPVEDGALPGDGKASGKALQIALSKELARHPERSTERGDR